MQSSKFSKKKCEKFNKATEQKNNEDYETILSNLANDIRKRQLKLSEIRLRERRSTLLATLYTLGAWGAYVSIWYLDSLPAIKISKFGVADAKGVKVLPVLFGPVVYVLYPQLLPIQLHLTANPEFCSFDELFKSGIRESGTLKVSLFLPCISLYDVY